MGRVTACCLCRAILESGLKKYPAGVISRRDVVGKRATTTPAELSKSYFSPATAASESKTPPDTTVLHERHSPIRSHPCPEGRVQPSAPVSHEGSRAFQDGSRAASASLTPSPRCQQSEQAAEHHLLCPDGARHPTPRSLDGREATQEPHPASDQVPGAHRDQSPARLPP